VEDLSPELAEEREELCREIHGAFGGVSREGGESWRSSMLMDQYGRIDGTPLFTDRDRNWHELVADPEWVVDPGIGGFAFLDAIAFRYYLPAALMRCVLSGADEGVLFHLTLDAERRPDRRLEKWSRLDERQKRCVARFLRYMRAREVERDGQFRSQPPDWWDPAYEAQGVPWNPAWAGRPSDEGWRQALESYWDRFEDEGPEPPPL